jgi:hypothetical protein
MKAQGVTFILRYFSNDPEKDLSAAELASANAAGLPVGVVWETTANRMLAGHSAGVDDAEQADGRAMALGMRGLPLYFACDVDPNVFTDQEWAAVFGYLDGSASVIGPGRNGGYGGYEFIKRAFDAGKIRYGWQTYAWSGTPTKWDARAQLRQVQNDVTVCGVSADWDTAHASDWGQWPRPAAPTDPPQEDYMQVPGWQGSWLSYEVISQPDGSAVMVGQGRDGYAYYCVRDAGSTHSHSPAKLTP